MDNQCPSKSREYQNCSIQDPQPSKNQQKDNIDFVLSSDCDNDETQITSVKKPEVDKVIIMEYN